MLKHFTVALVSFLIMTGQAAAIEVLNAQPIVIKVSSERSEEMSPSDRRIRRNAEQGDAASQYVLGLQYELGVYGVTPQNYVEAVRWYRKAAERGLDTAKFSLGLMYQQGKGVPQSYAEAIRWYLAGAEQGYADAQANLGVIYGNGLGIPQDYVLAHMWSNLAASSGNKDAQRNRDILARRMTPDQVAEAQRLARDWIAKRQ